MLAGLGKKTVYRGFNRATQAVRQTGSASKPLTVLVPGIDKKVFTASTVFDDKRSDFIDKKGKTYSPTNNSGYLGEITLRRAVESSQNIPFVKMIEKVTPDVSIKYLEKMGITTLTAEDNNLALALGGLENGVSPLEMAGAYASIANDGTYISPIFYTKIENAKGKIIIQKSQEKRKIISPSVAFILKSLLTQPVEGANGTARNCKIPNMDVAAKTGTTDEDYDRWLCGFTNYYTAVTWYGFDFNENISYPSSDNPAAIIWSGAMNSIHKNLNESRFEKPKDVVSVTICSKTGNLATGYCPDTYTEYYLKGTTPNTCKEHTSSNSKKNNSSNQSTNTENNSYNSSYTNENKKDNENINTNTTVNSSNVNNNVSDNNSNTNTLDNNTNNSNINNMSNTNTNTNTNKNNSNITNDHNSIENNTTNSANKNTANNTNTNSSNTNKNNNNSTSNNTSSNSQEVDEDD